MNRLRTDWALYPDHVVFLGAEPAILGPEFNLHDLDKIASVKPPFIFSISDGVFENLHATAAQRCQLRCYYDVIARQSASDKLATLSDRQVSELLDWDAEKFRQTLSSFLESNYLFHAYSTLSTKITSKLLKIPVRTMTTIYNGE